MPTVTEFVISKEIKVQELDENFDMVKEVGLEKDIGGMCLHCMEDGNTKYLPSESWTRVTWCWKCSSITLKIVSDRMGGAYTDVYRVYRKEK